MILLLFPFIVSSLFFFWKSFIFLSATARWLPWTLHCAALFARCWRGFFHLAGKRDSHRCPFPVFFFEYVNARSRAVDTPCPSFRPATPLSAFRQVLPLRSEGWSVERRHLVWPWLRLVQRLKVCFLLLLFWEPIQRHCFGVFFFLPFCGTI